ncbi:MAG: hypothetical protein LRY54_04745 [Alphaproteobacteria bacterium]|nr:hypothetical protein [Alphaproteobacteria bacterium]
MRVEYPRNDAVCETDEQWAGRNLLRKAFMESSGQSREYRYTGYHQNQKNAYLVIRADRPLYWGTKSLEMEGRGTFPLALAKRDAQCMRAFLEANGVNVTDKKELHCDFEAQTPWPQPDLVRIYDDAPYYGGDNTQDPAAIVMLPAMKRTVWNLVRHHDDTYEF